MFTHVHSLVNDTQAMCVLGLRGKKSEMFLGTKKYTPAKRVKQSNFLTQLNNVKIWLENAWHTYFLIPRNNY